MKLKRLSLLLMISLLICGCGGGGSDSITTGAGALLTGNTDLVTLSGKLTGAGKDNATIIAEAVTSGMAASSHSFVSSQDQDFHQTFSDENGEFLLNVPEGTYHLLVKKSNRSIGSMQNVAAKKSEPRKNIEIKLCFPGIVKGKILNKIYSDNSGILVFIPGTSFMGVTDKNGIFTISDVPSGSYNIFAKTTDNSQKLSEPISFTVEPYGETKIPDAILELSNNIKPETVSLQVIVKGEGFPNENLTNCFVSIQASTGSGFTGYTTKSNNDGVYVFSKLSLLYRWTLKIVSEDPIWEKYEQPVSLSTNDIELNSIEVILPRCNDINAKTGNLSLSLNFWKVLPPNFEKQFIATETFAENIKLKLINCETGFTSFSDYTIDENCFKVNSLLPGQYAVYALPDITASNCPHIIIITSCETTIAEWCTEISDQYLK